MLPLGAFKEEPESTGSIGVPFALLDPALDGEDWRRAQAALSLAVDPQGPGQPVNWDNPATKRRGSFVPAGELVLVDGAICRPFSATIVHAGAPARETKRAGRACRTGPGEWTIAAVPDAPKPPMPATAAAQPLPPAAAPQLEGRAPSE